MSIDYLLMPPVVFMMVVVPLALIGWLWNRKKSKGKGL